MRDLKALEMKEMNHGCDIFTFSDTNSPCFSARYYGTVKFPKAQNPTIPKYGSFPSPTKTKISIIDRNPVIFVLYPLLKVNI